MPPANSSLATARSLYNANTHMVPLLETLREERRKSANKGKPKMAVKVTQEDSGAKMAQSLLLNRKPKKKEHIKKQ